MARTDSDLLESTVLWIASLGSEDLTASISFHGTRIYKRVRTYENAILLEFESQNLEPLICLTGKDILSTEQKATSHWFEGCVLKFLTNDFHLILRRKKTRKRSLGLPRFTKKGINMKNIRWSPLLWIWFLNLLWHYFHALLLPRGLTQSDLIGYDLYFIWIVSFVLQNRFCIWSQYLKFNK